MSLNRNQIDPDARDESRQASENSRTDYQMIARELVAESLFPPLDVEDVYVVWFSKTLQNWKAMVSTILEDDLYYEVTHNGDKGETYLDTYRKINNVAVPSR